MADLKGEAGSPSLAKPIHPTQRRTRMKSILAERAAVKAFEQAHPEPKRHYTKKPKPLDLSPAIKPKPKYVTINLQMRHTFNGKFYGPGQVTVTPTKAEVFLNAEHCAAEKELSLVQQQAFIIGVGPGGPVKRQVPWAQFDRLIQEG